MSRRSKLVDSPSRPPGEAGIPPFRGIPGDTKLRHHTARGRNGAKPDATTAAPGRDTLGRRLMHFFGTKPEAVRRAGTL